MKRILVAIFALCSTAAFGSDDDIMGGFYGNTIISTGSSLEVHSHYRADHSFDMTASMMGMSRSFKGTWALDDKGNVCRTYSGDMPPNVTNPQCTPIAAHKVGDTWTTVNNGNTRTLTLKAGIL